jgi:hypothetical protein
MAFAGHRFQFCKHAFLHLRRTETLTDAVNLIPTGLKSCGLVESVCVQFALHTMKPVASPPKGSHPSPHSMWKKHLPESRLLLH